MGWSSRVGLRDGFSAGARPPAPNTGARAGTAPSPIDRGVVLSGVAGRRDLKTQVRGAGVVVWRRRDDDGPAERPRPKG